MTETMKAAVLHAPGDLRVQQWPKPRPGRGQALIRVEACGVCGSDLPRVLRKGTYSMPMVIGHEFAGRVVALGPGAGGLQVGQLVAVFPLIPCRRCRYCQVGEYNLCDHYDYYGSRRDGAMAEYLAVEARCCVPVPAEVPAEHAAMCEPAAVALHGVRRSGLQPGQTAVVLGAGVIGLLVAQALRALGAARVVVVDRLPSKLEMARRLGLERCLLSAEDIADQVVKETGGDGAQVVMETAGVPATEELAFRVAAKLGRIVFIGNASADLLLPQATIDRILRRQLSLFGSWNSSFADLPANEWAVALDFMAGGQLQMEPLISHRLPLEEAPQTFRRMAADPAAFSKVIFIP